MSPRGVLHAIVFATLVSITGCQSLWRDGPEEPSAQGTTEAVRIKALFLEAPDLAGSAISVEYDAGRVVLSGFVEHQEQRRRAESIASRQEAVSEVVNRIIVK